MNYFSHKHFKNYFIAGELPTDGLNESVSEGSADFDEKNGDESDEETRTSPEVDDDTPIVTPKNFGDHMEARPTQSGIPLQRLVQSVKHVSNIHTGVSQKHLYLTFKNFRPRSVENSKLSRKGGWCTIQIRTL